MFCRFAYREAFKEEVSLNDGKGKVMICSIHNRKSVGADVHLFAVGKPKGTFYFDWWDHTPGLAPSRDLVTFTKEYNRSKGRREGWFKDIRNVYWMNGLNVRILG